MLIWNWFFVLRSTFANRTQKLPSRGGTPTTPLSRLGPTLLLWLPRNSTGIGGSAFKIVEIEALRIRRNFLLACAKGPVPNELVQEFRRFLFARAGARRASVQPRRAEPSLTDKKP